MDPVSVKWRKQGNDSFSKACDKSWPSFQKSRFEEALKCYVKALQSATNHDEVASAAKNVGVTSRKLASLVTHFSLAHHYYKQSLDHFVRAQKSGTSLPDKKGSWRDNVIQTTKACFQEAMDNLRDSSMTVMKRICHLEEYIHVLRCESDQSEGFLEIANILFKQGI